MRHEHLVVTVESGTKARIEDDLDSGETVEAWVADAIDEKLADDGRAAVSDHRTEADDRMEAAAGATDPETDDDLTLGDERTEENDEYDEGFEYVDDCSI